MHSRKKGKSGSNKPIEQKKKAWFIHDSKEVESLILKLTKSGITKSEMGLVLRDSYGIPDVKAVTNKTIGKILQENKVVQELPEDLNALIKKEVKLTKHLIENKHDQAAKRGLRPKQSMQVSKSDETSSASNV